MKIKEFLKTFFLVFTILSAFAGLFIYHFFFKMNRAKDVTSTPKKEERLEYIILLEIKEEEPLFFILRLCDNPEVINIPENLKLNYDGFEKTLVGFLDYGGCEYAFDALNSVGDIDGYFCLEENNLYNLIDVLDGANVNLKYNIGNLEAGLQTLYSDDFKVLIDYSKTLNPDGKINFRVNIINTMIDDYLFKRYTFSANSLYENLTKYSKTNVDRLKANKIIDYITELKEKGTKTKVAYLQGDFVDDNKYFILSNNGKIQLQKNYYDLDY